MWKLLDKLINYLVKRLNNTFGKILIPITIIAYYLTDNFILQLTLLLILFTVTRSNIHGARLNLIKSNVLKVKAREINKQ